MAEAYPLEWPHGWPRSKYRKSGRAFKNLTPDRAFRGLTDELTRLGARDVVLSTNLKPRLYAGPAGDPRQDPGVAIYFTLNGRQMTMAQDAYDSVYANARSLTLAIDAMRAIERHGGGTMMQRAFSGFQALPPPGGHAEYQKKPWRTVFKMVVADGLPKDMQLAIAEATYKKMARDAHPDSPGGDPQLMAELNVAIDDARQELKD